MFFFRQYSVEVHLPPFTPLSLKKTSLCPPSIPANTAPEEERTQKRRFPSQGETLFKKRGRKRKKTDITTEEKKNQEDVIYLNYSNEDEEEELQKKKRKRQANGEEQLQKRKAAISFINIIKRTRLSGLFLKSNESEIDLYEPPVECEDDSNSDTSVE
jgi:hypothetical protein